MRMKLHFGTRNDVKKIEEFTDKLGALWRLIEFPSAWTGKPNRELYRKSPQNGDWELRLWKVDTKIYERVKENLIKK